MKVLQARSVRMDGVNIWSQARGGLEVIPSASATAVLLNRVSVQNTCGFGIKAVPTGTGKVQLDGVDVSVAGHEVVGVTVGDGAVARFARSTFQQNKLALEATGAGQLVSLGGNVLSGNDDGDDSNDAATNGDDGRFTALLDQNGALTPLVVPTQTVVNVPGPVVTVPGPVVTVNTPTPLVVAIGVDPAPTVPGRKVVVPYASTALANATLQVKLGGKVVDTVEGVAKRGRNSIAWDGKLAGGKLAGPGTYTLVLQLTSADGQTDADSVSVKVVKPRATASAAAKPVRR